MRIGGAAAAARLAGCGRRRRGRRARWCAGPVPRLARSSRWRGRRAGGGGCRRRASPTGRERVDAAGEQHLGLVDVADAAGDPLVEQDGADLVGGLGAAAPCARRTSSMSASAHGTGRGRGGRRDPAASGRRRGGRCARPGRRSTPPPSRRPRPRPGPGGPASASARRCGRGATTRSCACGSAGVRPPLEVDEQVLADRLDVARCASPGVGPVARQPRAPRSARSDLPGERRPQPGGGPVDGVALGHRLRLRTRRRCRTLPSLRCAHGLERRRSVRRRRPVAAPRRRPVRWRLIHDQARTTHELLHDPPSGQAPARLVDPRPAVHDTTELCTTLRSGLRPMSPPGGRPSSHAERRSSGSDGRRSARRSISPTAIAAPLASRASRADETATARHRGPPPRPPQRSATESSEREVSEHDRFLRDRLCSDPPRWASARSRPHACARAGRSSASWARPSAPTAGQRVRGSAQGRRTRPL